MILQTQLSHLKKLGFKFFDRFIENFGTHILVGLSIGGQDLVLVKQDVSSSLEPSELKGHLDELGNQLFTGTCSFLPRSKDQKYKVSFVYIIINKDIYRSVS